MAGTPRLSLPFISVGQAQKEITHNEALQTLDVLVGGAVLEPPRASPPADPVPGDCYIVADGATGDWVGRSHHVAAWTSGGWRFIVPTEGIAMLERTSGSMAAFREGTWEVGTMRGAAVVIGGQKVLGPRSAAIESPAGGSTVDSQSRAAIDAILDALRGHGMIET